MIKLLLFACFFVAVSAKFSCDWQVFRKEAPDNGQGTVCWCEDIGEDQYAVACKDGQVDLKKLFQALTKRHGNMHMRQFISYNKELKQLEENVFDGFSFDVVKIWDANSLEKIHPKAFGKNADKIKELVVVDAKKLKQNSDLTFQAINTLKNAEQIIVLAPGLDIPANAFKLPNLKVLSFGTGWMAERTPLKIGANAFAGCDQLEELILSRVEIGDIDKDAFVFNKASNKTLYLNLSECKLTGDSFKEGHFTRFRRPVDMHLHNNPMNFLKRKAFKPFFDAHPDNVISSMEETLVKCGNCKNLWLVKDKAVMKRIRYLMCENFKGRLFNSIAEEKEWKKCDVD